jgi:hypothetical protein
MNIVRRGKPVVDLLPFGFVIGRLFLEFTF